MKLTPADRDAIRRRRKRGELLRVIGDDYGVTRERIRQITPGLYTRPVRTEADRQRERGERRQASAARRVARFWASVDKSGGPNACWPWLLSCDDDGNGRVVFRSLWPDADGQQRAHKIAFLLSGGKLTRAKPLACHTCLSPPCCNPAHLYAGSYADRDRACRNAGRGAYKLTADQARAIRKRSSDEPLPALAREFGVSYNAAWKISRRMSWVSLR